MSDPVSPEGNCESVLLVGASPRDARVVSCGFEREGVSVDVATDVREVIGRLTALSADDAALPALVALDFTTDPDDSRTVLNAIRASPRLRTLPTVALINQTVATEVAGERLQRAYADGVNGHVFSPDGVEAYADAVQRMAAFWFGHVSSPPKSLYFDGAWVGHD